MKHTPRNPAQLRLVLVFLGLVLVPGLFLGYFSLRAVENEKRARQVRLLRERERYAEFASRAMRHELFDLESTWQELVPLRAGWEQRLDGILAGLGKPQLEDRFVHAAWVLHASGKIVMAHGPTDWDRQDPAQETVRRGAPDPIEARLFGEIVTRGETAEFDHGDPRAALGAYGEVLTRIRNPRLHAMAHAYRGRVHLRQRSWDLAIAEYGRILERYPESLDLDNQPLGLLARLNIGRALEEKRDPGAPEAFLELHRDLERHSNSMSRAQYEFWVERIEEHLEPGLLPPDAKKAVDTEFYVNKVARKLTRDVLDEAPYSPRFRYISDVADGRPYLLAYTFLPNQDGRRVNGVLGFEIDLPSLQTALLPRLLRALDSSDDLVLAVVDEQGRPVIGGEDLETRPVAVRSNLGEPFEFWEVAVLDRTVGSQTVDFRTKVFLYVVLLLLLTLIAGTVLVTLGLRREARLANLKTSFVSNVSHELRTPLTSIRLYAEMLEMAGEACPENDRRRYLAVIRGECGRLERLIDAILDFASLSRGRKTLSFEYEEVGSLVRSVADSFRAQAEAEGFEYEIVVPDDLPEVRLDADAVRQVLLNLLSNAVKYSEDERRIVLRVFRAGNEVGLQVEDRGIGIEGSLHQRIFEDFYRVDDRLASTRQGVGLGLTVVRRIVEAHGGRVDVESSPGQGSRFTVYLPIEPGSGVEASSGRVAAGT